MTHILIGIPEEEFDPKFIFGGTKEECDNRLDEIESEIDDFDHKAEELRQDQERRRPKVSDYQTKSLFEWEEVTKNHDKIVAKEWGQLEEPKHKYWSYKVIELKAEE